MIEIKAQLIIEWLEMRGYESYMNSESILFITDDYEVETFCELDILKMEKMIEKYQMTKREIIE